MRYFPQTDADITAMLGTIKAGSVEDLLTGIPEDLRLKQPLALDDALDEISLENHMAALAAANGTGRPVFAGGGIYDHYIPSVVDALAGRSEFYTAYTPYQPEASQGHLQVFFEYQTMICNLTGMQVSNASMYDGASAAAEAALMACRTKKGKATVVAAGNINPEYLAVIRTYLHWADIKLEVAAVDEQGLVDRDDLAARMDGAAVFLFQNPNYFGLIEDGEELTGIAHAHDAYAAVAVDPISLGLLRRPGDYGADIVIGEGQSLGSPMYFGGHGFGIMASTDEFIRKIPGRIIGRTVDQQGRACCVLTLQTREQHIRRSRATSNICSNQAWCVTRAVMYMAAMGPQGLRRAAELSAVRAHELAEACRVVDGFSLASDEAFFKEFVLRCPVPARQVHDVLKAEGLVAGIDLSIRFPDRTNDMLVCATEKRTPEDIAAFSAALGKVKGQPSL